MSGASQRGFSLVELSVALFLSTVVLLGVAQLVLLGVTLDKSSADLTQVALLASDRLEQMKNLPYDQLLVGGDLETDVNGFFDRPDIDSNGVTDFVRRWTIADLGDRRLLQVRVVAQIAAAGPPRITTISALVASRVVP